MANLSFVSSIFVREVVKQAGFNPQVALADEDFEVLCQFVSRELTNSEKKIEEEDKNLKQDRWSLDPRLYFSK